MDYDNDSIFDDEYYWDNSTDDPPSPGPESRPALPAAAILVIAAYAVTFVVGVAGNMAVVWVTGCGMKRGAATVCFLNLAVADLVYCLSAPFHTAHVAARGLWPSDPALCRLLPAAILLNMAASVFLLTLISLDRCLALTRPVWAMTYRQPAYIMAACLGAWILAFLMCLPSFFNRRIVHHHLLGPVCQLHYDWAQGKALVEVIRVLFGFGLPLVVMATCYLCIGLRLRGRPISAKSRRPLRLIVLVVAVFCLCWFPYHVCGLLQAFPPSRAWLDWARSWDEASVGLASLNSALNPLIYVFAGRDFRRVFRRSLAVSLRLALSEGTPSPCAGPGTRLTLACAPVSDWASLPHAGLPGLQNQALRPTKPGSCISNSGFESV